MTPESWPLSQCAIVQTLAVGETRVQTLKNFFAVRAADRDTEHRGQLLKGAALLCGLASLVIIINGLATSGMSSWIAVNLSVVVMSLVVFGLTHLGYVRTSGILLTTVLLAGIFYGTTSGDTISVTSAAPYVIPIIISGLIIGSNGVLVFGVLSFLLFFVSPFIYGTPWTSAFIPPYMMLCISATLIWLTIMTLERALDRARHQAQVAITAQVQLEAQKAELEAANTEMQAANTQMTNLLDLVRDLETPVIPLLEGVLLVTLVGHVDTRRATQLTDAVLNAVYTHRARAVIVDVTGVSIFDTAVAQRIAQLIGAIQLLGARALLTGIRSEIAQTIITQGINFSTIETTGRLQDGIALVLNNITLNRPKQPTVSA